MNLEPPVRNRGQIIRHSAISAAIVVVAASVISGCDSGESRTAASGRGARTIPVDARVVKSQPLEDNITTTGTLLANEEVQLRPEVSGRVIGVYFQEGKKVHKGQLLLKLNDRELQAELKRKQLQEAQAADDERRKQSLLKINGISQEDYDRVLNNLNMVKAEHEVIESQLAETEIRAPFDGVVGLRHVSEGSVISPSTLVATMQDIDPIKVEFSVPERYAGGLKSGTAVQVDVGDSAQTFAGTVYAVESKVDPATRTLKGRATIPNPNGRLLPGSFCKVQITLQRIPDAIVIPAEAVIPELAGQKVFVCRDGKAQAVQVTTGIRTDRDIQITTGLKPNDTLILTGLLQLNDGSAVQLTFPATD